MNLDETRAGVAADEALLQRLACGVDVAGDGVAGLLWAAGVEERRLRDEAVAAGMWTEVAA